MKTHLIVTNDADRMNAFLNSNPWLTTYAFKIIFTAIARITNGLRPRLKSLSIAGLAIM